MHRDAPRHRPARDRQVLGRPEERDGGVVDRGCRPARSRPRLARRARSPRRGRGSPAPRSPPRRPRGSRRRCRRASPRAGARRRARCARSRRPGRPRRASIRATSAPIPRLAPVTSATLPVREATRVGNRARARAASAAAANRRARVLSGRAIVRARPLAASFEPWPGTSRPSPNSKRISTGCASSSRPSCGRWRRSPTTSSYDELDAILGPLQEQVKQRGLWAAHLPPELGGQGFGQVKLALMHEILGTTAIAPTVFGNQAPDSGNGEIIAIAGTPEQKRDFGDPLLAGELRSAFSMTEPGVAGSDPTEIQTRAVRDGDEYVINGHKWFSSNASRADFLIVMAVTDPDAPRHRRASMFIVPVDTPGVNILRDVPTMEFPGGHNVLHGGHAEIVYEDVRVPADGAAGRGGRGLQDRPAAARARAHPPLHALHRPLRAGVRHALRARDLPREPRQAARRAPDDPELDRRLGGRDARGAADDAARRVGRRPRRLRGRPPRDLADQVLRRRRADQRRRPRAADPRRARLLDRPAARGDVPLRARHALLRRRRRAAPRRGGAADPAGLRAAGGRRPARARPDPPGRGPRTIPRQGVLR